MVTGGTGGAGPTEVLRVGDDAWTIVGASATNGQGLRGVNLGNRLLMSGTININKIVVCV